jgi:hypothetical protein
MNTAKTIDQICHEKMSAICAQNGITEIFSGTGYSCDRPHAVYTYEPFGIYLRIYPFGDMPNKPYSFHKITPQ